MPADWGREALAACYYRKGSEIRSQWCNRIAGGDARATGDIAKLRAVKMLARYTTAMGTAVIVRDHGRGRGADVLRPRREIVALPRLPTDWACGSSPAGHLEHIYAGSSSPRVTSETIGRDINPLGRGSGMALVGGELALGSLAPRLPFAFAFGGTGSSINNSALPPSVGGGSGNGDWSPGPDAPDCCKCPTVAGPCCGLPDTFMDQWEPGDPSPGGWPDGSCCCPEECGPECAGDGNVLNCPGDPAICEVPYTPCGGASGGSSPGGGGTLPPVTKGPPPEGAGTGNGYSPMGGGDGGGCPGCGNGIPAKKKGSDNIGGLVYCDKWVQQAFDYWEHSFESCKCYITNSNLLNCLTKGMEELTSNRDKYIVFCTSRRTPTPRNIPTGNCEHCAHAGTCAREYHSAGKSYVFICCNNVKTCLNPYASKTFPNIGWERNILETVYHEAIHIGGHILGISECLQLEGESRDAHAGRFAEGGLTDFTKCMCYGPGLGE